MDREGDCGGWSSISLGVNYTTNCHSLQEDLRPQSSVLLEPLYFASLPTDRMLLAGRLGWMLMGAAVRIPVCGAAGGVAGRRGETGGGPRAGSSLTLRVSTAPTAATAAPVVTPARQSSHRVTAETE